MDWHYALDMGDGTEADLEDASIVGASYLAHGVTAFPEWSEKMLSELGERFRPFLPLIFEKSNDYYSIVKRAYDSPQSIEDDMREEENAKNLRNARAELDSAIADWHELLRRSNPRSDLMKQTAQARRASVVFSLIRFAAAAIALYAIAKHPYNFYVLTRWVVFLVCCWGFWICRRRIWSSFGPIYLAIGLLFNPLFPFHFERSTWQILDAIAGITLLASLAFHRSVTSPDPRP